MKTKKTMKSTKMKSTNENEPENEHEPENENEQINGPQPDKIAGVGGDNEPIEVTTISNDEDSNDEDTEDIAKEMDDKNTESAAMTSRYAHKDAPTKTETLLMILYLLNTQLRRD
jgi:hypothetical protein